MNKFARDMLMSRYNRDGRGYSSSDSGRYSSNDTMIREPRYSMPDDRFEHLEHKRMEDERRNRDRERRDYNRDYGDYERRDRRDYERRDYDDREYDRRSYDRDYDDREYRRDRGYDRDYNRDYGETQYGKMSRKDIEKWKHSLMNADGTRGEHFKKEQIEPIIKKADIDIERIGGMDAFCIAVNMMYSDICKVAKKYGVSHVEYYVDLAKAFFLEDEDFHGKPEEKLWLYYKCIAESEE